MKTISFVWVVLFASACGNRATQAVNADASSAKETSASTESDCPYPDGVCDFDGDCPADHHCEGAMHTTGTPHVFVCRGICVADPAAKPVPTLPTGCKRGGGPLQATLVAGGLEVNARVLNCSSRAIYHLSGCCGEDQPELQELEDGRWTTVECRDIGGLCCDGLPTCNRYDPGDTFETRVQDLEACACGRGTFRVKFTFSEDANCSVNNTTSPVVTSTPMSLWCDG